MAEEVLSITTLNDFIFCPASIYFHQIDRDADLLTYQTHFQLNGTAKHDAIDNKRYSTKSAILQGIPVFSERYNLYGKIDLFDIDSGVLTERKKKVNQIFDGYVYQLFAQCFGLEEQGFKVNKLQIYSMDDNKLYPIKHPLEDIEMLEKFEKTIDEINKFSFDEFKQDNLLKCKRCIYEPLCSYTEV